MEIRLTGVAMADYRIGAFVIPVSLDVVQALTFEGIASRCRWLKCERECRCMTHEDYFQKLRSCLDEAFGGTCQVKIVTSRNTGYGSNAIYAGHFNLCSYNQPGPPVDRKHHEVYKCKCIPAFSGDIKIRNRFLSCINRKFANDLSTPEVS